MSSISSASKVKSFGIVGGGIAGLYLGYTLSKKGHFVTIYDPNPGGLAATYDDGFYLEMFYHHFFLSDTEIINLMGELGISDGILKCTSKMGFYYNGKLYPFASPFDLLNYTPLSILSRIRLGMMILYFQKSKNWHDKESISVRDWVSKYSGSEVYEKVWHPLLVSKFSHNANNIPASWLWGRIHPRAQSRHGSKEVLCYPNGSFKVIFDALMTEIEKYHSKIVRRKVEKVVTVANRVEYLKADSDEYRHDYYILTVPNPIISRIVDALPMKYGKLLAKVEYQAIICMKVFLKRSLSKFYWINIADKNIVFGGIIEHTNIISRKNYNDMCVAYLFNYVPVTSELWKKSDAEIFLMYRNGLKIMFSDFKESDIIKYRIDRSAYASPVYDMNYTKKIPPFRTPFSNMYLTSTAQIYPDDRSTNNGIKYVKILLEKMKNDKVI